MTADVADTSHRAPQAAYRLVLANAFDHLRKAAEAFSESHLTYSVEYFATGLELILKARLMREHWALLFAEPHKASPERLSDGSFKSIGLDRLIETVFVLTRVSLRPEAKATFHEIRNARNRALHFHVEESAIAAAASQQVRGWGELKALLQGAWADAFDIDDEVDERVRETDERFHFQRDFLSKKYDQLKEHLEHAYGGRLAQCSSCRLQSAVLERPDEHLTIATCEVCGYNSDQWRCDSCNGENLISHSSVKCRHCGEAVAVLGFCGSCNDHTVGAPDGITRCFSCGTVFIEQDDPCEWCGELWFGSDLGESYAFGCGECGGSFEAATGETFSFDED